MTKLKGFTEKVSPKYEWSGGNVWRCSKSNFPGDFRGATAFFWDGGKMKLVDNDLSVLNVFMYCYFDFKLKAVFLAQNFIQLLQTFSLVQTKM